MSYSISEGLNQVKNTVTDAVETATGVDQADVDNFSSQLGDALKDGAETVTDGITDAVSDVTPESLLKTTNSTVNAAKDSAAGIFEQVEDAATDVAKETTRLFNSVQDAFALFDKDENAFSDVADMGDEDAALAAEAMITKTVVRDAINDALSREDPWEDDD